MHGGPPQPNRPLSTQASRTFFNVVEAAWPKLIASTSKHQHEQEFLRVLDLAAQGRLPRRGKHRSYPRLLWRRGGPPKFRKAEEN